MLGGWNEDGEPTKTALITPSPSRTHRSYGKFTLPAALASSVGAVVKSLNLILICGGYYARKMEISKDTDSMEGQSKISAQ